MNLNVSPMDLISSDDGDQCRKPFGSNNQVISSLSSSNSVACHIFFNPTQDQTGYFHHQLYQSQYQEDDTYASQGGSGSGSSCQMKNMVENSGFKLSLESEKNIKYPVKWMSSKMRLMQKIKNADRFPLKITSNDVTTNLGDHNLHQISSSLEIDLANNNSSYNNTTSSSSCPIRVCSDCHTTKTPLWRSGPKGPKTLCNACGIRQRKARRALAAAAAAVSTVVSSTTDQPSSMKIKVQQNDKTTVKTGNVTQLKKRYKMAAAAGDGGGSPSNVLQKKLGFEDFLINLSENLKFHRVFPEDEKDAAILLMALSSGLVHG